MVPASAVYYSFILQYISQLSLWDLIMGQISLIIGGWGFGLPRGFLLYSFYHKESYVRFE